VRGDPQQLAALGGRALAQRLAHTHEERMATRTLTDVTTQVLSRAWFGADLLVGIAAGTRCPNCGHARPGTPVHRRRGGLLSIWRCGGCGLLYRPVGITAPSVMRAYYTFLYGNADLATDFGAVSSPATIAARMAAEGKNRLALIEALVPDAHTKTLAIVGCSWGYELLPFRERGFDVFGIEIGETRRAHGRATLGLDIYASPADAAAAGRRADLVLSSHMIEHVPALGAYLDAMVSSLRPSTMVHIAPHVDALETDESLASIIGAEHPLGITKGFWSHYAATRSYDVSVHVDGYVPGVSCGEIVARVTSIR